MRIWQREKLNSSAVIPELSANPSRSPEARMALQSVLELRQEDWVFVHPQRSII